MNPSHNQDRSRDCAKVFKFLTFFVMYITNKTLFGLCEGFMKIATSKKINGN